MWEFPLTLASDGGFSCRKQRTAARCLTAVSDIGKFQLVDG